MNKIIEEKLIDYVMGSLTAEEEREIATYLNDNPEDAAYARDLFEIMADVATQEESTVDENAITNLLTRVRSQEPQVVTDERETVDVIHLDDHPRRGVSRRWWLGFALAAALTAFAYLGIRSQIDPYARQLATVCNTQGSVCERLTDTNNADLAVLARRADNSVYLVFNSEPPAGQAYQAWDILDGTPRSLGVFQDRKVDITEALSSESTFGITLEPAGGSPQPTSTPIVAVPLN